MKCPADLVIACDKQPECKCGFCKDHCICPELVILIGSGGSGKTFLAQKISKEQGHTYINFDKNYSYAPDKASFLKFLGQLANINNQPEEDFVLDGYLLYHDPFLKDLKSLIRHHKIKVKIVFDSIEVIRERRKKSREGKGVPLPLSIIAIYQFIGRNIDWAKCEMLNTSTLETVENYHQLMLGLKNPISREEVEAFVGSLQSKGYQKYYQTIELPFGVKVKGQSTTEESWSIINRLVSFKEKSVVDLGCNHGYQLFKAEELGAKSMLGLDQHPDVIATAQQIAFLKSSFAEFKVFDADNEIVPGQDIGLALNVLYHTKKPYAAFQKMLCCKEVVIETKLDKQALVGLAEEAGHELVAERQSPRKDRKIMVFRRLDEF